MAAKRESQITISITPTIARELRSRLAPDFRKDGSRGLALTSNLGASEKHSMSGFMCDPGSMMLAFAFYGLEVNCLGTVETGFFSKFPVTDLGRI